MISMQVQVEASLARRVLSVQRVSGRKRGYGKGVLDSGGRVSRPLDPSYTTVAGQIRRESLLLVGHAHFRFL